MVHHSVHKSSPFDSVLCQLIIAVIFSKISVVAVLPLTRSCNVTCPNLTYFPNEAYFTR